MTTEQVLRDIEAQRATTGETKLEDELSIYDWMNRIKGAATQAGKLARQPDSVLEYDAWVELAAIVVGRAEQVLRLGLRADCEHDFPSEELHAECRNGCGALFGESR